MCKEKNIRDQIIEGSNDGDTIENLLQESDLTLAKMVTICRSREAAKKNRHDIHTADPNSMAGLAAMHRPRQQQPSGPTCQGCGHPAHQGGRRQCPAYNQICISCHKVGYFAKMCRSKSVRLLINNTPQTNQQSSQQSHTTMDRTQPRPGFNALHVVSHGSQSQSAYRQPQGHIRWRYCHIQEQTCPQQDNSSSAAWDTT